MHLYHPRRRPTNLWVPLSVLLSACAVAQEPASPATQAPAAKITEQCVLLQNGNVLFGVAEQRGGWLVVRSGEGNELRLPIDQVACWADSMRDLFQFRLDRQRTGDPQVHLEDARWCLRYRLYDLAAGELRKAYRLDPQNQAAGILEEQLLAAVRNSRERTTADQAIATAEHHDPVSASPDGSSTFGEVVPASHSQIVTSSPAVVEHFTHAVQPLLINRCGRCHSHLTDRNWQLFVPTSGNRPSARMTRENLTATIAFIDPNAPETSELVQMAVTPHGDETTGIAGRDQHELHSLLRWIEQLVIDLNRADDSLNGVITAGGTEIEPFHGPPMATSMTPPSHTGSTVIMPVSPAPQPTAATGQFDRRLPATSPRRAGDRDSAPARLPEVHDPFDPALFNRRVHGR